jgi:hypothetical protein
MCGTHNLYGADEQWMQIIVRKPEGKRQLGKPWCRWKDNIEMCVDWIKMA